MNRQTKLEKRIQKAFAEQARTHAREMTGLDALYKETKRCLRDCLELVKAAKEGTWTFADNVRWEEIKAWAKLQ